MSKLFEEIAQGTAEARAYMEGERKGYKVTLPESIDVRGIRQQLHFSQGRFADARLLRGCGTSLGIGSAKPGSCRTRTSSGDCSRSASRDARSGPISARTISFG